ncbi:MAG: phosphate acyltransferase PlsX [Clostridia bacterium]|nr:phosphate acyltransferase PlsX [Clostridia bacterium]
MRIIIDVMSGDNAPAELIKGALIAVEEFPVDITIVGDETIIEDIVERDNLDLSRLTIVHADDVINMEDKPLSVVRDKSNSSMSVGLRMLAAGEGDAFVSAGNTGALIAGATLIVRRIKGVQRAGIATVLPLEKPMLLMDSGANLVVNEENLEQFAMMGSIYMKKIFGIESPKVGQLNNGTEYNKGLPLQVEAYKRLSEVEGINFVGNIEGKEVPFAACDVLVTDGFTGNILLKVVEGMGKFMLKTLKGVLTSTLTAKISALGLLGQVKTVKKKFDASEYGGAPLLGISRPVIKAHGSSDANAIKNAIRQAIQFVNTGINVEIAEYSVEFDRKKEEERQREREEAEKAKEAENSSKESDDSK